MAAKTVEEMYHETKLPKLRFYLLTTEVPDAVCECPVTTPGEETATLSEPFVPTNSDISQTTFQEHSGASPAMETQYVAKDASAFNSSEDLFSLQSGYLEDNFEYPSAHGLTHGDDLIQAAMNITGILDDSPSETIAENPLPEKPKEKLVIIHRGQFLKELICAFSDVNPIHDVLKMRLIDSDGKEEPAEDGGGVTRDILSEFWTSFYEECTEGIQFKVPCLRHDFGETEWRAVARIIVFGWREVGYFPVQLSQVFLEECCLGQTESNLQDNFMLYLADTDRETLKAALSDIESVDMSELIDLLGRYEAKVNPTKDNIVRVVAELAHKELIQKPMFVVDCWRPILAKLRMDKQRLATLYRGFYPTTRKVIEKLKFPENMTMEELAVSNHLRRFVRELDEATLKKFLRFTTGSDLLVCDHIDVSFVVQQDFERCPVAHTCSCLLELSKNYANFPQFRKEFKSVLESSVWIMDLI